MVEWLERRHHDYRRPSGPLRTGTWHCTMFQYTMWNVYFQVMQYGFIFAIDLAVDEWRSSEAPALDAVSPTDWLREADGFKPFFTHKSTNLPMKAVTFEFDSYTNHIKLLCSTIWPLELCLQLTSAEKYLHGCTLKQISGQIHMHIFPVVLGCVYTEMFLPEIVSESLRFHVPFTRKR